MNYETTITMDSLEFQQIIEGKDPNYMLDETVEVISGEFSNGFRLLIEVKSGGVDWMNGNHYPGYLDVCIVDADGEEIVIFPPGAFDGLKGKVTVEDNEDTYTVTLI